MTKLPTLHRSEHAEQATLMQIAQAHEAQYPDLRWLYAIPNGGKRDRVSAALLKAEGVKRGHPDLALPSRRGAYPGLVIEMKVGSNRPSRAQRDWLAHYQAEGWLIAVCYSADEAWALLENYVRLPK